MTKLRYFFICFIAVILVSSISFAQTENNGQGQEKIIICHIPPGNPDNKHTITISVAALETHLEHGDTVGACDDAPPPLPQ